MAGQGGRAKNGGSLGEEIGGGKGGLWEESVGSQCCRTEPGNQISNYAKNDKKKKKQEIKKRPKLIWL